MINAEGIYQIIDACIDAHQDHIQGIVVVATDGMLITSRIASTINPNRVGAIAATMMGVTARVVADLEIGIPHEVIISAEHGYMIIYPVKNQIVLAVLLNEGANLALTRLMIKDTSLLIEAV